VGPAGITDQLTGLLTGFADGAPADDWDAKAAGPAAKPPVAIVASRTPPTRNRRVEMRRKRETFMSGDRSFRGARGAPSVKAN